MLDSTKVRHVGYHSCAFVWHYDFALRWIAFNRLSSRSDFRTKYFCRRELLNLLGSDMGNSIGQIHLLQNVFILIELLAQHSS